jgi:hypothetical protein
MLDIIWLLNKVGLPINFISHLIIFVGTFYVAMKNKNLPQWHITPLWYLGLFNLFISISIVIYWVMEPGHPLGYWQAGLIGETLSTLTLAFIAFVMFSATFIRNHRNKG